MSAKHGGKRAERAPKVPSHQGNSLGDPTAAAARGGAAHTAPHTGRAHPRPADRAATTTFTTPPPPAPAIDGLTAAASFPLPAAANKRRRGGGHSQ